MESRMMTTSSPISTRRRARSRVISATAVCRSAERSKVEEITSPNPHASISVTSSGRSSTSRMKSLHSWWFVTMPSATACRTIVFPALAGGHDHRPLSLAEGAKQVDHTVGVVRLAPHRASTLEAEQLVGVYRREAVEVGAPPRLLGIPAVDYGQVDERRALPVLGPLADLAPELVTRAQSELLDDPAADVDVVVAGEVTRLAAPDETGSAPEDLEDPQTFLRVHYSAVATLLQWYGHGRMARSVLCPGAGAQKPWPAPPRRASQVPVPASCGGRCLTRGRLT